jgi:hypothetical protein
MDRGERECCVTAISIGNVFNDDYPLSFFEGKHAERDKSYDIYEFYNVLCLEWREAIAYRKGLGRVAKAIWENQILDWVDITLG